MKNKLKILERKPELTDSELYAYQNFRYLLKEYKRLHKIKNLKIIGYVSLLLLSGIFVWLNYSSQNHYRQPVIEPSQKHYEHNADTTSVDLDKRQDTLVNTEPFRINETLKKINLPSPEEKKSFPGRTDSSDKDKPIRSQYIPAEPVYGYDSLYMYFFKSLTYPQSAIEDSVQGVVYLTFTINKSGRPEKIKVDKSPDERLSAEAIRLIENMPPWHPARLNDQPINSSVSVPIVFRIVKNERNKP